MSSSNTPHFIKQLLSALDEFTSSKQTRFGRIQLDIEPVDVQSWFKGQKLLPKTYWSNKQNKEETATFGAVLTINQEAELSRLCESVLPKHPNMRLYGGRSFDGRAKSWPDFPNIQFILPILEFRRLEQRCWLICNLSSENGDWQQSITNAKKLLHNLQGPITLQPVVQKVISRQDLPDYQQWQTMVTEITSPDFQAHTAKVVLSRETKICCNKQVNAMDLLNLWQQRNPNSFQFIFQFKESSTFMGCSPERLYRREASHLVTEALAGTVARGETLTDDQKLATDLLNDEKCRHENQLVLDDIASRLHEISRNHHIAPEPRVLKLNKIQHLKRDIEADINPNLSDYDLLDNLHPTPAVGGSPRASALHYIKYNEPHNRGWYAGAVGYISHTYSEFSVAIRSALLEKKQIKLYAGAGIVTGSNPDQEWFELDQKISTVLSIFGVETKIAVKNNENKT